MIVRNATVADVRAAYGSLSEHSARELEAAAARAGYTLADFEEGTIAARRGAGLLAMFALCDVATDRPGALFMAARGEVADIELAGLTTTYFPAIKPAFWLWAARRFLPEFVDRHGFRSRCSVVEDNAVWLAMLQRLGFRATGRSSTGGRVFVELLRVRPSNA